MINYLPYIAFITVTVWTLYAIQITVYSTLSLFYKSKKSKEKATNVDLVIVTVASKTVKGALYEVLNKISKFELNVNVVVDEGAELTQDLKRDFKLYVFTEVPKSFKCRAIAKGRAIEYFIRTKVYPSRWYVFLDDDSYPMDDKFLYEISEREQHGYVAANGMLYPRKGHNIVSYVLDFFRYLDDLTFFRACQGTLKRPLCGFHGELLIVKGRTLKEIGFDRHSITEDFCFGTEILRRGYKTWSSNSKVSIQSPNSLKGLLTQRARWFKGIVIDLKNAPLKIQLVMGIHLARAVLGCFGSFAFVVFWVALAFLGFNYIPTAPLFLVGTTYWLIGAFIMPKTSWKNKFVTVPLSAVETLAPLYALLKTKKFEVIDKN